MIEQLICDFIVEYLDNLNVFFKYQLLHVLK